MVAHHTRKGPTCRTQHTGASQAPDETRQFFQYHLSGRLTIRMDDGTEFVAGPGDVTSLPSGHDAWVLGDETVIVVDWYGANNYAKTITKAG